MVPPGQGRAGPEQGRAAHPGRERHPGEVSPFYRPGPQGLGHREPPTHAASPLGIPQRRPATHQATACPARDHAGRGPGAKRRAGGATAEARQGRSPERSEAERRGPHGGSHNPPRTRPRRKGRAPLKPTRSDPGPIVRTLVRPPLQIARGSRLPGVPRPKGGKPPLIRKYPGIPGCSWTGPFPGRALRLPWPRPRLADHPAR